MQPYVSRMFCDTAPQPTFYKPMIKVQMSFTGGGFQFTNQACHSGIYPHDQEDFACNVRP